MSTTELPILPQASASTPSAPARDATRLTAARRARQLSLASLVWMSIEGIVGCREAAPITSAGRDQYTDRDVG